MFSCKFCEISKDTFFHITPLAAASKFKAFLKNYVFQAYGKENIKLVTSERRSFNIVPEMFFFPKIYVKMYIFLIWSLKNDSSIRANKFWHFQRVGPKTRNCWWNTKPETLDPSCGWDSRAETRDLKLGSRDPRPGTQLTGRTRDLRPGTLKVRTETRHLGHLFYTGRKTQDPGHWKKDLGQLWKVRPEIQIKHLLLNLECKNYNSNKLSQAS